MNLLSHFLTKPQPSKASNPPSAPVKFGMYVKNIIKDDAPLNERLDLILDALTQGSFENLGSFQNPSGFIKGQMFKMNIPGPLGEKILYASITNGSPSIQTYVDNQPGGYLLPETTFYLYENKGWKDGTYQVLNTTVGLESMSPEAVKQIEKMMATAFVSYVTDQRIQSDNPAVIQKFRQVIDLLKQNGLQEDA